MASIPSSPNDTTTVRKDTSAVIPPAPAPADVSEKPPAESHASSSELGVPGSFPRDPRIALDHLSDQAVATGAPESTTYSTTIIDAVQEDFRHAVDTASQYLPESVAGAIGSVLPAGTTDTQDAAKKLDSDHVRGEGQTTSKLSFKDIAVGGIASPDFTPSSSSSRFASDGASEVLKGADGVRSAKPSFLSSKDFAIAGIALDFNPSSSKSRFVSSSAIDDSLDTPAATPTPKPRGVSSPAATKEKRDNDAPHSGADRADAQRSEGTTRDSDLRRKAIETVALGAGIGTLGGAAYQYSGASEQPGPSTPPEAQGVASAAHHPDETAPTDSPTSDAQSRGAARDTSSASVAKQYPSFATYAPPSAVTSDSLANPTTSVIGPSLADDSSKAKEATEGAAIGAGIGAVGGAAYNHSRSGQLPTPPEEESDDKTTPAHTSSGTGPSKAMKSKATDIQPAFVSYVPGPVITEDTPFDDDDDDESEELSPDSGTAETRGASSDQDRDLSSKGTAQAAALGLGAGIVGGAAGSAAAHSREPQTQESSDKSDLGPSPMAPEGLDDEAGKDVPPTSAVRDEDVSGVESQSGSKAVQDGAKTTEVKDTISDQSKKAAQAVAVGVGAGAVGAGAASTAAAGDRNAEKEQQEREKEAEKEHEKQVKEAEKREKEAKEHEKEVATAALAADKKAAKENEKRHVKELEKEDEKRVEERKEAGKEQAKREQVRADKDEDTKKREAELATAAVAGTGVGVGAVRDKQAKRENEPERADSQQGVSQVKDEPVLRGILSAQQPGSDTKGLSPEHPSVLTASEARKHEKEVATGTAAIPGVGVDAAGAAGDKLTKRQASDETKKIDPDQEAAKETVPVHPSIKAASVPPESRPGPTALGAAGPNERPRSGADSDFPLPSVNASREHASRAVDINGKGAGAGLGTLPSTAPGQLKPSTSPIHRTRSERSRYYGTEGLQEKLPGGALRSSFIERKKAEEKATHEHGNGNGKKEGFVRHLVEKVKNKVHHRRRASH